MKPSLSVFAAAMALLSASVAHVHGGTITYSIMDIGTSSGYMDMDTTHTFAGTGYVGMYGPDTSNGAAFAHFVGLEKSDLSRTELQVDTTALVGATIQSATLSFYVRSGTSLLQTLTVQSFTSNGKLAYNFDAPNILGSMTAAVRRSTAVQSIDVTNLLGSSLASNSQWFALNLAATYYYQYTWAWNWYNNVPNPDAASMRLTVNYTSMSAAASTNATAFQATPTALMTGVGPDADIPSTVFMDQVASPEPATVFSAVLAVVAAAFGLRRKSA